MSFSSSEFAFDLEKNQAQIKDLKLSPPRSCIDVAEKYNLRPKTRFNQDVTAFKWNDDRNTWTLSIAESDGLENLGAALPDEEFDLVFNYRKGAFFGYVPDVPGARDDTFKGLAWHSMDWKVGGMGLLKGKNVAVVGLAAAGIQIIPCIAPHCGSLTIYPRTPNHIHPKPNDPFSEEQKAEWAKDPVAYRMWCAKMSTEYFAKWEGAMLHPGSDIANAEEKACADMLEAQVKDPKLREVFRPNYKPWARRMLFSNEFYPTVRIPSIMISICRGTHSLLLFLALAPQRRSRQREARPHRSRWDRQQDSVPSLGHELGCRQRDRCCRRPECC